MSQKHFQMLADELAECKPLPPGEGQEALWPLYAVELGQWSKCVRAVATVCARSNANFDVGRFFNECRYEIDTRP